MCAVHSERTSVRILGASRSGRVRVLLGGFVKQLLVGVDPRLAHGGGEAGKREFHRLLHVTEDRIALGNAAETARGDHIAVDAALIASTEDIRPLGEIVRDGLVDLLADAKRIEGAVEDRDLGGNGRVVLIDGHLEPLKESLVLNAGADEGAIVASLALGVGRADDGEALGGSHEAAGLLEEHALALKHGLKAHDLERAKIDLVKEENRTAIHRLDNRAVLPDGVAVNETVATKKIVLVSLLGDVDAEHLATLLGADLLDHDGLAVARQTVDPNGVEHLGLDDGAERREVAPRDIDRVDGRDEVLDFGDERGDCSRLGSSLADGGGDRASLHHGLRRLDRLDLGRVGTGGHGRSGNSLGNRIEAATRTAVGGIGDPHGSAGHAALLGGGQNLSAVVVAVVAVTRAEERGESVDELALTALKTVVRIDRVALHGAVALGAVRSADADGGRVADGTRRVLGNLHALSILYFGGYGKGFGTI